MSPKAKNQGIVMWWGETPSTHNGGADVYFWVENLHPLYSLGQEICYVLLYIYVYLNAGLNKSALRYLGLALIWVGNFDARFFFFWGGGWVAIWSSDRLPPCRVYCKYPPPWGLYPCSSCSLWAWWSRISLHTERKKKHKKLNPRIVKSFTPTSQTTESQLQLRWSIMLA